MRAITLADFYFLESDPVICFEIKRGYTGDKISSIEELVNKMESNTEIDCLIKDSQTAFKFQLKQYPEEYKEWSADKVIAYLDETILPIRKYNNELNKDLIIIIAIKPKADSSFKGVEDFDEIHKYLIKKEVRLKEINFLINLNMEYMVWNQAYPENGHYKIPWNQLSYHVAKIIRPN